MKNLERWETSSSNWKRKVMRGENDTFLKYFIHEPNPGAPFTLVAYRIHRHEDKAKNVIGKSLDDVISSSKPQNIIFVPVGSHKTDIDLNWSFDTEDPEVVLWKNLLNSLPIDRAIMIHHDYELKNEEVYGYVQLPENAPFPIDWKNFMESLAPSGVVPFNGIDDKDKPALRNEVVDGLVICHPEEKLKGNLENFIVQMGAKYAITFELPDGLNEAQYYDLLIKVFTGLLIMYNTNEKETK